MYIKTGGLSQVYVRGLGHGVNSGQIAENKVGSSFTPAGRGIITTEYSASHNSSGASLALDNGRKELLRSGL